LSYGPRAKKHSSNLTI